MAVYKRCEHKGTKAENNCRHDWWGQFMFKGTNYRVNLVTWTGRTLPTKTDGENAYESMRSAVKAGTFCPESESGARLDTALVPVNAALVPELVGPVPADVAPDAFRMIAARYVLDYLEYENLKSKDDETQKVMLFVEHFGNKSMQECEASDLRALVRELRKPFTRKNRQNPETRGRRTENRYLARLRALWNWARAEGLTVGSPFMVDNLPVMGPTSEEGMGRHRRLIVDLKEEQRLMDAMPAWLQKLFCIALDTGMRQGEMFKFTIADLDARPGWIQLPGPFTKTGFKRYVPISTPRLAEYLKELSYDAAGRKKPLSCPVLSHADCTPMLFPTEQWEQAVERSGLPDFVWRDIRHEYASRLAIDLKRPLPEVQMLLGHKNIKTTMTYVNVVDASLQDAVVGLGSFVLPISTKTTVPQRRRAKLRGITGGKVSPEVADSTSV